VRYGYAVLGRSPLDVLPVMSDDDVREAARAELTGTGRGRLGGPGYDSTQSSRTWGLPLWPAVVTRRRRGELLTKAQAVECAVGPAWLVDQLRARHKGEHVPAPRVRAALIAWRDARRTVARAQR